MNHAWRRFLFLLAASLMLPGAASAWNPYVDGDPSSDAPQVNTGGMPFGAPSAPLAAPAKKAAAPAPQPVAYQPPAPAPTYIAPPTYTPPPAAPAAVSYSAPAYPAYPAATAATPYAAPYSAPQATYQAPASNVSYYPAAEVTDQSPPSPQRKAGTWRLGVEGFYDAYREPSATVKVTGVHGSVTAAYDTFNLGVPHLYTGGDFRFTDGTSNYKSSQGKISGIPEQELEARWKLGYSFVKDGHGPMFYSGFGTRYYLDDFKGYSVGGASGYDRSILQTYLPFGMNMFGHFHDWSVTSNLEYDHLIYGFVNSRLQSIPGYENAWNRQYQGFGVRGDVMFGRTLANGDGYEFGPYVRYWEFPDSAIDRQAAVPGGLIEPENTRLQMGMAFKYLF